MDKLQFLVLIIIIIQTGDPGAISIAVNPPLAVVMTHDFYSTLKSIRRIQRRWWLPGKTV